MHEKEHISELKLLLQRNGKKSEEGERNMAKVALEMVEKAGGNVDELVEAERCAVRGYTHTCNLTVGKAPSHSIPSAASAPSCSMSPSPSYGDIFSEQLTGDKIIEHQHKAIRELDMSCNMC